MRLLLVRGCGGGGGGRGRGDRRRRRQARRRRLRPGPAAARGGEDGGRAQRPATVQHPEEGDCREGRRSDLRRVLLAQECEDQLCSLGVSPAWLWPGDGRAELGAPRRPLS